MALLYLFFCILITSLRKIFKDASSKIRASRHVFFSTEFFNSLNFFGSHPKVDEFFALH